MYACRQADPLCFLWLVTKLWVTLSPPVNNNWKLSLLGPQANITTHMHTHHHSNEAAVSWSSRGWRLSSKQCVLEQLRHWGEWSGDYLFSQHSPIYESKVDTQIQCSVAEWDTQLSDCLLFLWTQLIYVLHVEIVLLNKKLKVQMFYSKYVWLLWRL